MRYAFLLVVNVAWALWFGATIATFVFGLNLFHTHPDIAGEANSAMFMVFAKYELALAAVALTGTGLLLITYPSKMFLLLLACLIVASGMAVTAGLGLTPQMEALRLQGKQHTEEFKKYHGKAMITMVMQSGALLLTGVVLLAAAGQARKNVVIESSPPTDSEYEPMFDKPKR